MLHDRLRSLPSGLLPPLPSLRTVVAVPVKDEAERLPRLIKSLAAQRDPLGQPLGRGEVEVILLLNNCCDESERVAGMLQSRYPGLMLRVCSVELRGENAHVGRARQLAMDLAYARLRAAGAEQGLICTTDADSCPAPDWVAQNTAEVASGADFVGGRVALCSAERAALSPEVRALYLLDLGYRRLIERLADLYCPSAHDPYPRHHQHYGASIAVTARTYAAAGGLPAVRCSEDVALKEAVEAIGGRVRHSDRVRVFTSARHDGRAAGGLASAFLFWEERARSGEPVLVEPAWHAERRWAAAARRSAADDPVPARLARTPEPDEAGAGEPIRRVVAQLRALTDSLHRMTLSERLDRAFGLPAPFASLCAHETSPV